MIGCFAGDLTYVAVKGVRGGSADAGEVVALALLLRASVFAVIRAKFVADLIGAAENVIGRREGATVIIEQHNVNPSSASSSLHSILFAYMQEVLSAITEHDTHEFEFGAKNRWLSKKVQVTTSYREESKDPLPVFTSQTDRKIRPRDHLVAVFTLA